ncbi:hypothetical protein ACH5RR_032158 [Cinchona calisaya]|uniref:ASCH domain-containing protein n=1 Tax=Cinchona calisaya TaxID=153742 RepID=A0ABD2YIP0_9GENT
MATEAPPPAQPASPGVGRVQLKDCIEELLKFTLTSSVNGELDLGLSKDYCSQLLQQDDSSTPFPSFTDTLTGVPSYPLYKHLAATLYQSISSGTLFRISDKLESINEDNSYNLKEEEWTKLIMEEGSQLQSILATVDFELHVQEPFFSQLKDGQKTVEGRCAIGNYNRIVPGAFILFNKSLLLQVQDVHRYVSFREMLEAESLQRVLPGVKTIEEGVQVYRNFYSEEKESSNGVIAICVTKPTSQLYNCMTTIILGLSCGGIQRMLNMVHTVGTNLEKLPPPASTLISSFLTLHNPHVKGSKLTGGARALAKHVNRSSDKYWGNFWGSDSNKNRLAFNTISHLVARSCWLNMHTVPPHGVVFEIRVAEGFGARWSEDGHQFIGFLEPYMMDGHSKRWKH